VASADARTALHLFFSFVFLLFVCFVLRIELSFPRFPTPFFEA
jgi:hypothetical protein